MTCGDNCRRSRSGERPSRRAVVYECTPHNGYSGENFGILSGILHTIELDL